MTEGKLRNRGAIGALSLLLATGLAALPRAASASSTSRHPSAGFASSTPRCSASALSFIFISETGGAGKRFDTLGLLNRGRTCHLWGYPGLAMLNASGRLINVNIARRSRAEEVSHEVVLRPGRRAYFTFFYEDGGFCPGHSVTAYGLQTYPPGSTRSLRLHRSRFEACANSTRVVGPVRATKP